MSEHSSPGKDTLLPCPLCGSKAAVCILEDEPGETLSAWVACDCGLEIRERLTEAEAIKRWNTRAPAQQTWQLIETAPRDGKFILVFYKEGSPQDTVAWDDDRFQWSNGHDDRPCYPTHWKQLDAGPAFSSTGLCTLEGNGK